MPGPWSIHHMARGALERVLGCLLLGARAGAHLFGAKSRWLGLNRGLNHHGFGARGLAQAARRAQGEAELRHPAGRFSESSGSLVPASRFQVALSNCIFGSFVVKSQVGASSSPCLLVLAARANAARGAGNGAVHGAPSWCSPYGLTRGLIKSLFCT